MCVVAAVINWESRCLTLLFVREYVYQTEQICRKVNYDICWKCAEYVICVNARGAVFRVLFPNGKNGKNAVIGLPRVEARFASGMSEQLQSYTFIV